MAPDRPLKCLLQSTISQIALLARATAMPNRSGDDQTALRPVRT